MSWLLTAALLLAPEPSEPLWNAPPSLPGSGMHVPGTEYEPVSWQRRRRVLTRTVAVFGAGAPTTPSHARADA